MNEKDQILKLAELIGHIKGKLYKIHLDLLYKTESVSEDEYLKIMADKCKDLYDNIGEMTNKIYKD
jgi:hypothetical protein